MELSEETPKTDSSTEKDIGVTIGPVSDLFPTPPASSLDASEVASPSPTIDTGLFKVSQEPRPGSLQDEIKTEPSIIIIDEDLVLETVEDVAPSRTEPPFTSEDVIQAGVQDLAVELDQTDIVPTEATEESPVDEGSGLHSAMEETTTGVSVTAPPPLKYVTTPHMTTATQGRELVVFFSLRVTNMDFSDDLFNKTSSEYRTLENTFLDVVSTQSSSNGDGPICLCGGSSERAPFLGKSALFLRACASLIRSEGVVGVVVCDVMSVWVGLMCMWVGLMCMWVGLMV